MAAEIPAKEFNDKPQYGVADNIDSKTHPGFGLPPFGAQQQEIDRDAGQDVVDLGRMQCLVQRGQGFGIGEGDGPGQGTFFPETTSGRKAAKPSHSLSQRKSRSDGVSPGPDWLFATAQKPDRGPGSGQGAAEEDQSSLPELHDFQRVGQKVFGRQKDVKQPGADYSTENEIKAEIRDDFVWQTQALGFTHGHGHPNQEGSGDEKTVCVDRERSDINEYGMHGVSCDDKRKPECRYRRY